MHFDEVASGRFRAVADGDVLNDEVVGGGIGRGTSGLLMTTTLRDRRVLVMSLSSHAGPPRLPGFSPRRRSAQSGRP
ncbi:hypothetical protein HMPREF9620_01188 [Cutibacterium acnes HL037PA1]|nr:hypothetical protein HMPREF9620_01188 [Cutibacterium acnes HL037PA1]